MSSPPETRQPYVEDYDSVISEVVPLTRRHTVSKSGLSNETPYDAVSDSGYSSTNSPSNANSTPPLKSTTPGPAPSKTPAPKTPGPESRRETLKRASTPGNQRPTSSKPLERTSDAVPRTIPSSKPRERSPKMSITGGADECDCADCKKDKPSSSPSAPVSAGGWPIHNAYNPSPASYEQSPPAWTGYQYPPSRFDAYAPSNDSGISDSSRNSERKRTSMPPPPRPASTYSHATSSSSYSGGYGNYFNNSPPSAHTAPTPSSTCPPTAFSAYAPPPLNSSAYSSAAYASYAPSQSTIPVYGSSYDDWGRTASTQNLSPGTSYPSEYSSMPPLPSLGPSTSNRRNSLRANAAVASYNEYDDYNNLPQPPQRRSSRASAERPSWSQAPYIEGFQDRSVSVPPQGTIAEPIRRRTTTPGPAPSRRRDSGNFNQLSGRLGPSALSRAMESCTIVDEPPPRTHSRSHSDYYGYGPGQGQLARRDPGTVMYPSNSDSGSSSRSDPREDLNPINIQRNSSSGAHRSPPHKSPPHHRKSEGIEYGMASYRYVQQRQQAVHEQLQYGALEHGSARDPVAADYPDYPYRPSLYGRRATMGSAGF